jgi:hypothetical protein
MSTKDYNSINHNKDYDDELWLYGHHEDVNFNDLMNSNKNTYPSSNNKV